METQAISAAFEAAAAVLVGGVGLCLAWGRPLALAGFGLIVAGLAVACAGSLSLIVIGPGPAAAVEHGLVLAGVAALVLARTRMSKAGDSAAAGDDTVSIAGGKAGVTDEDGIVDLLHELSQPIHIIKMSAEGALLKIGRGEVPSDFVEKQFSRIDEQCARLVEVMEALRSDDSPGGSLWPGADSPAPVRGADARSRSPVSDGRRVLLVDDEHDVATTLADFLVTVGLTVRVASNPEAALTFALEGGEPPDILVTDLHMPGMNGVELIRRLRRALPDLPVVVITGNVPDDQDLGPVFDNDHTILLRKPVSLGTLDGAVSALLGGSSSRS